MKRLDIVTIGVSLQQAQEVVQEALVHPLDKLLLPTKYEPYAYEFKPDTNGISDALDTVNDIRKRDKKDTDFTLVLWDLRQSVAYKVYRLVTSHTNPLTLAHELGHVLGLEHPSANCNHFAYERKCFSCEHRRNILGCGRGEDGKEFSLNECYWSDLDLAKLGFPRDKAEERR
ncbi:MAG: hypothetical protein KKE50_03010 [Nanoarchaeota archaeon]|nr:hypothetical protein [Nanoarchaeota archaeon]